jgi:hypothetical protein
MRSFGLRPQDDKERPNGVILSEAKNLLFFIDFLTKRIFKCYNILNIKKLRKSDDGK